MNPVLLLEGVDAEKRAHHVLWFESFTGKHQSITCPCGTAILAARMGEGARTPEYVSRCLSFGKQFLDGQVTS